MVRKIPFKNYIIISVILIISVAIVVYLANWYQTTNMYYKNISIIADFIKEVKVSEIDNYITENPDFVIYLANKNEILNVKFEKSLKKLITKNDLQKQFIFVDKSAFDNENFREFITKHGNDIEEFSLNDCIIIIDNQQIKDLIIINESFHDAKMVELFLKENGVL